MDPFQCLRDAATNIGAAEWPGDTEELLSDYVNWRLMRGFEPVIADLNLPGDLYFAHLIWAYERVFSRYAGSLLPDGKKALLVVDLPVDTVFETQGDSGPTGNIYRRCSPLPQFRYPGDVRVPCRTRFAADYIYIQPNTRVRPLAAAMVDGYWSKS